MNEEERKRLFKRVREEIAPQLFGTAISRFRFDWQESEDLLQETLALVWQKLDQLKAEDLLAPWVWRIHFNQCRKYYRSRHRRPLPWSNICDEGNLSEIATPTHEWDRASYDPIDDREQLLELARRINGAGGSLIRAFLKNGGDPEATRNELGKKNERYIHTTTQATRNKIRRERQEAFKLQSFVERRFFEGEIDRSSVLAFRENLPYEFIVRDDTLSYFMKEVEVAERVFATQLGDARDTLKQKGYLLLPGHVSPIDKSKFDTDATSNSFEYWSEWADPVCLPPYRITSGAIHLFDPPLQ